MFVYMAVIYSIIASFGSHAQAGFGIGSRVMQAVFLPAMAISFAVAPLAWQNFGARNFARVRAAFKAAVLIGSAVMLLLSLLCQWQPDRLVHFFTTDPEVVTVATEFLRIISLNFIASGLVFTCSGMFQALGNTLPALIIIASRLLSFVLPALWLSHQSGFNLHQLWRLSVCSVAMQALLSLYLLWRVMSRDVPKLDKAID